LDFSPESLAFAFMVPFLSKLLSFPSWLGSVITYYVNTTQPEHSRHTERAEPQQLHKIGFILASCHLLDM
jgi:hypothetical protein